jgi:hypothetical protein
MYNLHLQGTRVSEDEGSRSLQKSVNIYLTAQDHIPKDSNLHRLRVFENWMLRIISRLHQKLTGHKRRLTIQECHNLCSYPVTIRVMKPRRRRQEDYVAHMKGTRNISKILFIKPNGKKSFRKQVVMGKIVLKYSKTWL